MMHSKANKSVSKTKPKPFLSWVGNKKRIADNLLEYVPNKINDYYEPFLGSGALFFGLHDKCHKAYLSDINLDLTTCYNAIKNTPYEVAKIVDDYENNTSKEYFYYIKDNHTSNNPSSIGAKFLYINRYSFKSIYRLTLNNKLNIAYYNKHYKNKISDSIKQSSQLLKNAVIYARDFSFIEPKEDDFVYFDPPYHNSGEGFYTRLPFDESEQYRLKSVFDKLNLKGVKLMLSNNGTDFITNLYKGYNLKFFDIQYAINNAKTRNKEVIITNY